MTKKDLELYILEKDSNIHKDDLKLVTDLIFDKIKNKLATGTEVAVANFGKFKIVDKKERLARNPKTGEEITIASKRTIKFGNSKNIKDTLNA